MDYLFTFFVVGLIIGFIILPFKIEQGILFLIKIGFILFSSSLFYTIGSIGGNYDEASAWAMFVIGAWTVSGVIGLIIAVATKKLYEVTK